MEDCQRGVDSDACSIEGWTKEEKFYLLQALKVFRSHDIDRIHKYITTKSPQEIVLAINHYKKIASKHPVFVKPPNKPKKYCKPRVPLTSWANLLTDNLTLEELKTETSTAVRMIAELEKTPDPVFTDNIDFKKVYHTIANAMEGKTLVTDKITVAILNKCILETALSSKAFIKTSSYKYIMNNINLVAKETQPFLKLAERQEITVLRHLAFQRNYNPLKVPEAYMQPSIDVNYPNSDADTKTIDTNTADTNTADTKTADTNTADTNTADTKTADTKTADTNTADTNTADTKTAV